MYPRNGIPMLAATKTSTEVFPNEDMPLATQNPQSGHNKSRGGTNNAPMMAGILAGIVAIASILFILICIHQQRRRRAQARPRTSVMQQGNLHTYHGASAPQYPSIRIPQIQGPDLESNSVPTPPESAYTHSKPSLPRSQSYQTGQSTLLDSNSNIDTSRLSQGTFPSSGNTMAASRLSLDTTATRGHLIDKKLAPPSTPPSPSTALDPPADQTPANNSPTTSEPPSRSDTETALPRGSSQGNFQVQ